MFRQRGYCQLIVWWRFLAPGPQGTEGCELQVDVPAASHVHQFNFSPEPHFPLGCCRQVNENTPQRLTHKHREWQSKSHPLLLKLRGCKHLIWLQSTSMVLFPGRRCCSWSFQPTDFDRRPWWERSIAFSRSKRNGEQYRENWDMCLSLSKRIHSLASAWRKAVSIYQALKEARAFFKAVLRNGRIMRSVKKRKYSAGTVCRRVWGVIRDTAWCTCSINDRPEAVFI